MAFFNADHKNALWTLVLATYLLIGLRLCIHSASSFSGITKTITYCFIAIQVIVAVIFKAVFTLNDDPDLVPSWVLRLLGLDDMPTLEVLAKLVYATALLFMLLIILSRQSTRRGLGPRVLSVRKSSPIPLSVCIQLSRWI